MKCGLMSLFGRVLSVYPNGSKGDNDIESTVLICQLYFFLILKFLFFSFSLFHVSLNCPDKADSWFGEKLSGLELSEK